MSETVDLRPRIAELADQCVKCGLCVPLCPTYRVANTEAESPRGRIAFAQALASGAFEPSRTIIEHLDHCLACMTCERVCPSHVLYGELIVDTRNLLRESAGKKPLRWMELLVRYPALLRWMLRIADAPMISAIARTRIVREAPRIPATPPFAQTKTASASRGRVALFLGCVASIADRDVHVSAKRLLTALGYDVIVPRDQGCCGALSLHNGDAAGCEKTNAPTRRAFIAADVDTVLVSASGCFGTMRDHVLNDSTCRVREIHEFLQSDSAIDNLIFKPLPNRIALHTPCTQANVARADEAIFRLLTRIPAIDIVKLPQEPRCCGAAGDYFLRHPHMSDALRAQKLDQTLAIEPDILVTSNVGCRVFLDNGLNLRARSIEVTHPIVLLARQLQN
jgi:glycolate oxidase iron-sulfur subunit